MIGGPHPPPPITDGSKSPCQIGLRHYDLLEHVKQDNNLIIFVIIRYVQLLIIENQLAHYSQSASSLKVIQKSIFVLSRSTPIRS